MKLLTNRKPGHYHNLAVKPFAKYLLLGGSVLALAGGCASKDEAPVPYNQSSIAQQGRLQTAMERKRPVDSMSQSAATSPEIAQRLQRRKNIVEEMNNARSDPKMAGYRSQLVQALVLNGTVSQVPGEYDTVVLGHLADYALKLDDAPAARAIATLMGIARIDYDGSHRPHNRSVALATAALRSALKNPLLTADSKQAINEFLANPEAIELQSLTGNMPPCCETPQRRQASSDSVTLRIYHELVPDPEMRRRILEQAKRQYPDQFRH
jgi:hypothetical protein